MVDGKLVITGRSKDLIIFNGRNIWPQDLEWAVEKLRWRAAGRGRGLLRSMSMTSASGWSSWSSAGLGDPVGQRALRHAVRATVQKVAERRVRGRAGSRPARLTFTTSGKLSRAAAKANYLAGTIQDVAAPLGERADARDLESSPSRVDRIVRQDARAVESCGSAAGPVAVTGGTGFIGREVIRLRWSSALAGAGADPRRPEPRSRASRRRRRSRARSRTRRRWRGWSRCLGRWSTVAGVDCRARSGVFRRVNAVGARRA